jgi:hypothetical protein
VDVAHSLPADPAARGPAAGRSPPAVLAAAAVTRRDDRWPDPECFTQLPTEVRRGGVPGDLYIGTRGPGGWATVLRVDRRVWVHLDDGQTPPVRPRHLPVALTGARRPVVDTGSHPAVDSARAIRENGLPEGCDGSKTGRRGRTRGEGSRGRPGRLGRLDRPPMTSSPVSVRSAGSVRGSRGDS